MNCLFDDFRAAHIRSERNGNVDGAVCVEVVFQECDQHSRRSDDGVVERVGEVLAVLAAVDADFQAARLCVAEVGAGAYLEVLLLAGRPRLDVE